MATGLSNQLTRQIGEHLVTAELGRRGIIATPFAGNVPHIDLLAIKEGKAFPIQVKAINEGAWQFDIRRFLRVETKWKHQVVGGPQPDFDKHLICIFIKLGTSGTDEFYIFRQGVLLKHFMKVFKGRDKDHKYTSFHCAIWPKDLKSYQDNWKLITKTQTT